MARKRQSSQELRDLFDDVSTPDISEEENAIADDNFDRSFSDCDEEADVELENNLSLNNSVDDEESVDYDVQESVTNNELPNIDQQPIEQATWYYSQNKKFKRKWSSNPTEATKIRDFRIMREREGLTGRTAQDITSQLHAFQKIIPETLINVVVAETNRKARQFYNLHSQSPKVRRIWYDTDSVEVYALIGVLIYAGVHKNWDERLDELYCLDNRPFYRATMSLKRLQQLLRFLRFDNYQTRTERLKQDKLAPIRDVWNMFLANLKQPYKPSGYLTVDEQLVLTRGRCSFRQYIPSKPGKYGIKIFWLCDSKNAYPLNGEIYVGKQPNEPRSSDYALNLVHRLSTPYINKGRTITMDNFFTSCVLAEQLLQKKTTIIGTIRKNKPDLPKEFTCKPDLKNREVNSSKFCFNDNLTLVSYIPKQNKNVLLLSSLHTDGSIDSNSNKPNIILDYNATKGGVDTLDKLVRTYTCKRKTRRWPMVLFFNMVDLAGVAALNLYKCANPQLFDGNRKASERKLFLKNLAMQLTQAHILRRLSNPQALKKSVKIAVNQIGYTVLGVGRTVPPEKTTTSAISKRSRCYLCPRSTDAKTSTKCHLCDKPCCAKHTENLCTECIDQNEIDSDDEDAISDDASA